MDGVYKRGNSVSLCAQGADVGLKLTKTFELLT